MNLVQQNKTFRALHSIGLYSRIEKAYNNTMLMCGPDWMVAVSSEGGSSVFPRQLCAMSSVQCPAAGRWRPALHSVAYPAIVRAWGPVTTARDNAPCLAWDGLAAHHGVTRRGVNTSTCIQSCVGRPRCVYKHCSAAIHHCLYSPKL